MEQFGRILIVLGTFLPVFGVILTAFLAIVLTRWQRLMALVLTPLLTYGLCDYFASAIAENGNMLFVALLNVYMLALCIYYPGLLIAGIIFYVKRFR